MSLLVTIKSWPRQAEVQAKIIAGDWSVVHTLSVDEQAEFALDLSIERREYQRTGVMPPLWYQKVMEFAQCE